MDESNVKAILSNGQTAEELTARLPIPGPGRPKDTEEQKIQKRAIKELVKEYKESLAEVLPALSKVLKEKALTGDVPAIKEVHDRVMNKATQPINGGEDEEGKPIPFLNFIK